MLVNLNEILRIAENKKIAIGAFNTPGLACLNAVLSAATTNNSPVIISHAELHEDFMPLETIGPIMVLMAQKAPIPVCVLLDHATDMDYIKKSLEIGFSAIMYDGSSLSYAENVHNTKAVIELARPYHANVEAELGVVIGHEAGAHNRKVPTCAAYTDPIVAKQFVEETKVDALAASFGAQHGLYTSKPQLDFDRIEHIHALTNVPLVMHGGSGICAEDIIMAIEKGIRKINYYSYMAKAGLDGAKNLINNQNPKYFHEITFEATKAMTVDVDKAIKIFSKKIE